MQGHFCVMKHLRFIFRVISEGTFKKVWGDGMTVQQFEYYISRFRPSVFRLAYGMVRNREDAEDITQDAFVRLYQSDKRFNDDEHTKAWLIRVTINLCKDMVKSAWYRHRDEPVSDISSENDTISPLKNCIERLDAESVAVIYLFYYEGYSIREIAEIRRTTSAAVRTRLTRARKQLRKMLSEEDYHEA